MRKVVINTCYGGFGLSDEAQDLLERIKGEKTTPHWDIQRDDEDLVKVVETLGYRSNGGFSDLAIAEIPDDVEWEIKEYDGLEWVAEKHRTWQATIKFKKPRPVFRDVESNR
jgi:hypothetical protein